MLRLVTLVTVMRTHGNVFQALTAAETKTLCVTDKYVAEKGSEVRLILYQ